MMNWLFFRYICPCKAIWRLFGYDIQYRYPLVERLNFHLEGEQNIAYNDDDNLEEVANRSSCQQSQFMSWLDANNKYAEAKGLTYEDYPNKFIYKKHIIFGVHKSKDLQLEDYFSFHHVMMKNTIWDYYWQSLNVQKIMRTLEL